MSTLMNLQEIKNATNFSTFNFERMRVDKGHDKATPFINPETNKQFKDKEGQAIFIFAEYNRAWNNDDRVAVYVFDETLEELANNPEERKFLLQELEEGSTELGTYARFRIVMPNPSIFKTRSI